MAFRTYRQRQILYLPVCYCGRVSETWSRMGWVTKEQRERSLKRFNTQFENVWMSLTGAWMQLPLRRCSVAIPKFPAESYWRTEVRGDQGICLVAKPKMPSTISFRSPSLRILCSGLPDTQVWHKGNFARVYVSEWVYSLEFCLSWLLFQSAVINNTRLTIACITLFTVDDMYNGDEELSHKNRFILPVCNSFQHSVWCHGYTFLCVCIYE